MLSVKTSECLGSAKVFPLKVDGFFWDTYFSSNRKLRWSGKTVAYEEGQGFGHKKPDCD